MSKQYTKHTGTFTAHSEDGTEYTIFVYTFITEYNSNQGHSIVEGVKSLKTSEGEFVRLIKKGKYQIDTGFKKIDLVSDDANAL